jgi:hypothetical protein
VNRRALRGCLDPNECRALQHAWVQAATDGFPLNVLITVRPVGEFSALDLADMANEFWNRLGIWSRRRKREFRCILTREATRNGERHGLNEHWHALVHVPAGQFASLEEAVVRWYPDGEAHITRAHQRVTLTRYGKIESAYGYLTKQRTPQASWGTRYRRQPGGMVLGKRFKITPNLRLTALTTRARSRRFSC